MPNALAPRPSITATNDAERWQLVSELRPRLVAFAYPLVGNMHDAEDCASEAIVRAANYVDLDEERVDQFLFTLTRRLCVDVLRARAREGRALVRATIPSPCEPAEDICDRAEAQWVMSLVSALPQGESSAMLALADGARPKDAAHSLGMTAKAFESAVGRARKRLKVAWRATLGLMALTSGRILQRTHHYASTAASTTAAFAAAALVVAAPSSASEASAPAAAIPPSNHASDVIAAIAFDRGLHGAGTGSVGAGRVGRATARGSGGAGPRPSSQTIASTPPVHGGNAVGTGGGPLVSQHDDGDGPVESVLDCVTKGVQITPQKIGCRD